MTMNNHDQLFYDSSDNRCLFLCEICGSELRREEMGQHVRGVHNISYKRYLRQYGHELRIARETWHLCKVCRQGMLFDFPVVGDHLVHNHYLTLSDYGRIYNLDQQWLGGYAEAKETPASKVAAPSAAKVEQDDYSICVCSICRGEVPYHLLAAHLRKEHPGVKKKNLGNIKFVRQNFYRCENCDKEMILTPNTLKNHKCSKFSQSLKVKRKDNEFDITGDGCNNDRKKRKKLAEKEEFLAAEDASDTKDKIDFLKSIDDKFSNNRATQAIENSEYLWSNKNLFKCAACNMFTKDTLKLWKHVRRCHKSSLAEFHARIGKTNLLHECGFCGEEVYYELNCIKDHVETHMSYALYERLYMDYIQDPRSKIRRGNDRQLVASGTSSPKRLENGFLTDNDKYGWSDQKCSWAALGESAPDGTDPEIEGVGLIVDSLLISCYTETVGRRRTGSLPPPPAGADDAEASAVETDEEAASLHPLVVCCSRANHSERLPGHANVVAMDHAYTRALTWSAFHDR